MSQQEDPQTEHYQPAFNGILSINDYEQEQQEGYPEEAQELPFDEIEQILSDPSSLTTHTESLLLMAVNYLQQRCTQLASSNGYLQIRQQDLLQELSFQGEVEISQQIAHSFLESVQQELDSYKNEFREYRERHLSLRKELVEENGRLGRRVDELEGILRESQAQRDILEQESKELQERNEELMDSNSQLQKGLEEMEDQLQSIREERHQGTYRGNNGHRMEGKVQAEMQGLIDKLMAELQAERRQRLTISAEYKQLQKQLLHLERELSDKNNKIYQLELHSLRQNRNNQPVPLQAPPSPRGLRPPIDRTITSPNIYTNTNNTYNNRQQSSSSSSFRTFSLATVNGTEFTKKSRLVIAVKVVQFYLRKVNKGDLTTHTLEGLVVYNYSALYPQACIIRKDKALPSKEGQCTQERLVWNLAFILDHILTSDGQEALTKTEARMASLINSILEEQSCTIADMEQLRTLAEQASKVGNK